MRHPFARIHGKLFQEGITLEPLDSSFGGVISGGGGGGGGTPSISITQNGITFTFDKPYNCGQFVNGDWWAVPNPGDAAVTIVSTSPALSGSGATTQNGWMVNPLSELHCYDGRAAQFSAGLQLTLPYAAAPGKSIIKVASLVTPAGAGGNATCIDKAVVLTVLASAPAADAFRPPYFGTSKPIWRQSQLNMALLPSLVPVGSPPTIANVEERLRQVQLDHFYNTSPTMLARPLQSFHRFGFPLTPQPYPENMSICNCEAILRTFLNDTAAAKQNMVNYLVQAGIDWYGIANGGIRIAGSAGGGGHSGGRKIVVSYAGWLLGDSNIQAVAGETAGAGFAERDQFYWSAGAGGGSSHFTGQGAGMALFGQVNTFNKPFPYAGIGSKDIRDDQARIDGSLKTYDAGNIEGGLPAVTATYLGALYIDIASSHALLNATICGIVPALRTIFNYDPEIFYGDRLWSFGMWTQPDVNTRTLGAPVVALHGTQAGGALVNAGSYGSSFGDAMRAAYYATNTFAG